jgi:CRP-like cAMP-binding protein
MESLLEVARSLPPRTLAAEERLITEGSPPGPLYVLLDGALRIEKGGVAITVISELGASVGELSLLLGVPATADVVAAVDSVVATIDDGGRRMRDDPAVALALAQTLAARVQRMTTYLADLKRQYAEHEGGLGMIDVVLGSLMHQDGTSTRLGSVRDPHPEY